MINYVDGDGPPPIWSASLAGQLIDILDRLHRLPLDRSGRRVGSADAPPAGTESAEPPALPRYADRVERWLRRTGPPDESMRETMISTVLKAWWPHRQEHRPCILHGDYWPGNTLWREGDLVAVIDWEDAAVGDPRSDLANLRLELLWAYGPEAAADATRRYARARPEVDLTNLPYWDLVAATRPVGRLDEWGLDPDRMDLYLARFQSFVDAALDRIGGPINSSDDDSR